MKAGEFLRDQHRAQIAVHPPLRKINEGRGRHLAEVEALEIAELTDQRGDAANRMEQRPGDVVLLPLEKDADMAAARLLQFAPRDAAPAAAPLVGFLEPIGLELPEIIEAAQAVVLENGLPVLRKVFLHECAEDDGVAGLWQ